MGRFCGTSTSGRADFQGVPLVFGRAGVGGSRGETVGRGAGPLEDGVGRGRGRGGLSRAAESAGGLWCPQGEDSPPGAGGCPGGKAVGRKPESVPPEGAESAESRRASRWRNAIGRKRGASPWRNTVGRKRGGRPPGGTQSAGSGGRPPGGHALDRALIEQPRRQNTRPRAEEHPPEPTHSPERRRASSGRKQRPGPGTVPRRKQQPTAPLFPPPGGNNGQQPPRPPPGENANQQPRRPPPGRKQEPGSRGLPAGGCSRLECVRDAGAPGRRGG